LVHDMQNIDEIFDVKETNKVESETKNSNLTGESVSKNFARLDGDFQFQGTVPSSWKVEYFEQSDAINIFEPASGSKDTPDASQIFIKKFESQDFQTLRTVDILKKTLGKIGGHDTVEYVIQKKDSVPPFKNQPSWRNQKHTVLDVRFTTSSPSIFYVFAKNPDLSDQEFAQFVDSLLFHSDQDKLFPPIMDHEQRVTKKSFGIFISPETSPVQPEKFSGFHTGTDFETTPDELAIDIPVHAVCYGEIVEKKQASGYGGVIVQECNFNHQPITVIYGHLSFDAEFARDIGRYLAPGDLIATLGDHQSIETDGERKHLHVSIHKGKSVDIRGYVDSESRLNEWIDIEQHLE